MLSTATAQLFLVAVTDVQGTVSLSTVAQLAVPAEAFFIPLHRSNDKTVENCEGLVCCLTTRRVVVVE